MTLTRNRATRPEQVPMRVGGFAPLRDYAAIGDGRTVALVARDGRIDWFALPTINAPPVFAALLDANDGGCFRLAPRELASVTRKYAEGSNVLVTTFTTDGGVLRVTDSLNTGTSGLLPWVELARRVECLSGEVAVDWEVRAGDRFGEVRPWVRQFHDAPVLTVGDQHLVVRAFDAGTPAAHGDRVSGEFVLRAGSRALVALACVDDELMVVPERGDIERRIDSTIDSWRRWVDTIAYDGPWHDAVLRSALVLKQLIHAPTGAIAAAPTTSLPERIGGDRNFDYRYAWVRDSSFTIETLIRLGLHEEAHASLSWLLDTVGRTAPDLRVFYRLDGSPPRADADSDTDTGLPGYRGSRPVRGGNAAIDQTQLGNFGDLLDSVWLYAGCGHHIDPDSGTTVATMANRACDLWRQPDAGIWELPEQRHYTISKIGCWAALDRALQLAERGELSSPAVARWRYERDEVRRWIDERCWSPSQGSYVGYADGDGLDAAVLLAARTGFATGQRLDGTIDAIRRDLGRGPLLYRYTGMEDEEGAFVACSFWLVDALVRAGRLTEAGELMEDLLAQANDVGIFSEEIDPKTGAFLGNLPQALSHLALVTAAALFDDASRRSQAR